MIHRYKPRSKRPLNKREKKLNLLRRVMRNRKAIIGTIVKEIGALRIREMMYNMDYRAWWSHMNKPIPRRK